MVMTHKKPPYEKNRGTNFSDLKVGDRGIVIAEIIQIKQDEANNPPKWFLYYLYDGKATVRAFGKRPNGIEVGSIVLLDLEVKQGKPFNDKPQLSYKIYSMEKVEDNTPMFARFKEKFQYQVILRKRELRDFPDGTRIKLFTKILKLNPINGKRKRYQKILVASLENRPISLWFKKENFQIFEVIGDEEYFILKATVKTIKQNASARFLSFDSLERGEMINTDPLTLRFITERIKHHSSRLLNYMELRKAHTSEGNLSFDLLLMMLQSFQADIVKAPPIEKIRTRKK